MRQTDVIVEYHRCSRSLSAHLLAAGWFVSHPSQPTVAFHVTLMDLLYHGYFAAAHSYRRVTKLVSNYQREYSIDMCTDAEFEYERLVLLMPQYMHFKAALRRMTSVCDLERPLLPLCPACAGHTHSLHCDGCFQVRRQHGVAIADREPVNGGKAIVCDQKEHQHFLNETLREETAASKKNKTSEALLEV